MKLRRTGEKYPNSFRCPKRVHEFKNSLNVWVNPFSLKLKYSDCKECDYLIGMKKYVDNTCYIHCSFIADQQKTI